MIQEQSQRLHLATILNMNFSANQLLGGVTLTQQCTTEYHPRVSHQKGNWQSNPGFSHTLINLAKHSLPLSRNSRRVIDYRVICTQKLPGAVSVNTNQKVLIYEGLRMNSACRANPIQLFSVDVAKMQQPLKGTNIPQH